MVWSLSTTKACSYVELAEKGEVLPLVLPQQNGCPRLFGKMVRVLSKIDCVGPRVYPDVQNELWEKVDDAYADILAHADVLTARKISAEVESAKRMASTFYEQLVSKGIILLKKTAKHSIIFGPGDRVCGRIWRLGVQEDGYAGIIFTTSTSIDMQSSYIELKMACYYKNILEYEKLNIKKIILLNLASGEPREFVFTPAGITFQMGRIQVVFKKLRQLYPEYAHGKELNYVEPLTLFNYPRSIL